MVKRFSGVKPQKKKKKGLIAAPGEVIKKTRSGRGTKIEIGKESFEVEPGENIKTTKTGKGTITEEAPRGTQRKSEDQLARERTQEKLTAELPPSAVENELARQDALLDEVARESALLDLQTNPVALASATPEEAETKSLLRQIAEDPRTPIALAIGIAGLLTAGVATGVFLGAGGAAALAGGTAARGAALAAGARGGQIAVTKTILSGAAKGRSLVSLRALTGKPGKFAVDKIFHTVKPIASRFASNGKSSGLTKSFLIKLGLTLGAASLLKDAVGTYPFAGFIKEEALQTLSFATKSALDNADIVGAEKAFAQQEEILNNEKTIINDIPYLNIQKQLAAFMEAARIKLENDRKTLELLKRNSGQSLFSARQQAQREVKGG